MPHLTLQLQSGTQYEEITNIVSFIGWDESGSFGIQPNHIPMMTMLEFGLAQFRSDGAWCFLAIPSALLQFQDNRLTISTRHYLRGDNLERISEELFTQLKAEEEQLSALQQNLDGIEQEMLRRLWELNREGITL